MPISFLHTADFQIGRAFNSIGSDAGVLLRRQRINAVRRLAELAAVRKVDAVLVAGDVFDFNTVSNETLHAWLQAMVAYEGPWVVIPGNHDAAVPASVWQRVEALGRPDNLHVSLEPELVSLLDGRLAVLTAPLQRRHEVDDLTALWDTIRTQEGAFRVGLAHGAITSQAPAGLDATNPIAGDRETRSSLDYLALGDWHGTLQVGERTWYSGTPETDRFKDNDSGNVLIVTLREHWAPEVEKIKVGHFRWREAEFVIDGPDDVSVLDSALYAFREPFDEVVLNLTLTGVVDLDTRERVDHLLQAWRGRLLYVREHVDGLLARPSEADLDRIDRGGFVRVALDRLRQIQENPSDPNRGVAGDAIELLYRIHTGAEMQ